MAASVVQVDPILVVAAAVFVAPTKPVAAVVAAVEQAMLVAAVVAAAGQATAADFAAYFAAYFAAEQVAVALDSVYRLSLVLPV